MPLRVYLAYDGERHEYFIPDDNTVGDVKTKVQSRFLLGQDDGKSDKKVSSLQLCDHIRLTNNAGILFP